MNNQTQVKNRNKRKSKISRNKSRLSTNRAFSSENDGLNNMFAFKDKDGSHVFRDHYDDYLSMKENNSESELDSCSDEFKSEAIGGSVLTNVEKSDRSGRKISTNRSRSLRRSRSRSRSSRKSFKQSTSRKNNTKTDQTNRNGEFGYAKQLQNGTEKSTKRSGSLGRKPERKSSRKDTSNKSGEYQRFHSVVKTRIWIPKNSDGSSKSNSVVNSEASSEDEATSSGSSDCESKPVNSRCYAYQSEDENCDQKLNEGKVYLKGTDKAREKSKADKMGKSITDDQRKDVSKDQKYDDEWPESDSTIMSSLAENESKVQLKRSVTNNTKETEVRLDSKERKNRTHDKLRSQNESPFGDTNMNEPSQTDSNHDNAMRNKNLGDTDDESVSSGYSGRLDRMCEKYDVNSDTTDTTEEVDSHQVAIDNTEDSKVQLEADNDIKNDTTDNEGKRRKSVTFSDVVIARTPEETDADCTNAEKENDGATETKATGYDNSLIMENGRDGFRDEMLRLHAELMQFKKQCHEEADKCRLELEKQKSKLQQSEQNNEKSPVDQLEELNQENFILKRKQKLLDTDLELVEKEEELSRRSNELQDYEREIEEIEGYLNRRHDLAKRKEADILELDEELSRLKESLNDKKINFEKEFGTNTVKPENDRGSMKNWELVKDTIENKALTMQSTVKKYKANLATAENTMSDLHGKVHSLEAQLSKREQKIKELESQLSVTLSQVITGNNRDSQLINGDNSSETDPVANTIDTISSDLSGSNHVDIRRHSTPSTILMAPRRSQASLTPQASVDEPLGKNPLKPRWTSLREPATSPKIPTRTRSMSVKNGWRPVSRTYSEPTAPEKLRIRRDESRQLVGKNLRSIEGGNTKSNVCAIS